MKLLLLLGGLLGFGIGLVFSRAQENSWPYCLFHASLGAYAGGWLMGWWGRAWQTSLKNAAVEQQNRAAAAAASAPANALPKPAKS
jgi:hypothetical protein